MPTSRLTNEIIHAAILGFEGQKSRIDTQIAELRAMLPSSNGSKPETTVRKKRGMSAAGRAAVAEAQRKRWAATKEQSVAEPAKKAKRKLSPKAGQQSSPPQRNGGRRRGLLLWNRQRRLQRRRHRRSRH
jgi:peptidoglycan hydrolase CwlO-like protein